MSNLTKDEKKIERKLIADRKLKAVEELLKVMFGDLLEEMLVAELDEELGYSKYD